MRALRFDITVPKYIASLALGKVTNSVYHGGMSGLRLVEIEQPTLPSPTWTRLEVLSCGICGTDVATLSYKTSISMEPFSSSPAILGHEMVCRVVEIGDEIESVGVGDLVAVDPLLSCEVRGIPSKEQCPSCQGGSPGTCAHAAEEGPLLIDDRPLGRGMTIGYHRDLPGGWCDQILAHESQLHPLVEGVDPDLAVLIEPLSVAMHAVLGVRDRLAEPVLVIGSGPIALGTVWALRAVGFEGEVIAQTKRPGEARIATALGASRTLSPGDEARDALLSTGATAHKPIIGSEVFAGGGYGVIFDCVGSSTSLDQSLRHAGARGTVVMLGCAGELKRLDLAFIWSRELQVVGFVGYGREHWEGSELHTFDLTQELMKPTLNELKGIVTHHHPLENYRTALTDARNRRESGAIKVVFKPS